MSEIDNWVSAEFARLAQVVYEYDHDLEFQMVPVVEHHNLLDKTKVFRVVDTKLKKVVMYADSLANPQEILTRLFMMDQKHGDVIARMEAQNAAAEALRNEAILAEREAQKDLALFIAKNTKSRWQHEGRIRDDEFRDLGPARKVIT
jgi:hypothetical protein